MATHLANHYPNDINFLFVDRSLGNLSRMSESNFIGAKTSSILECFSHHWELNSDKNFLGAKCFKMVTQDPWD